MVVSLGAAQRPTNSESVNTGSKAVVAARKTARTTPYQVGTASWYGSYFQGRTTASGEPYDMNDLTAAHPSLPLGSWVRVTNLRNGRAVVVRINDRGPIVPGRIIDLSYNSARVLHFDSKGLQRVRLDVVENKIKKNTQPQIMAALQY
jgi:rare lipoprotein A